jgi:hypothetical protein
VLAGLLSPSPWVPVAVLLAAFRRRRLAAPDPCVERVRRCCDSPDPVPEFLQLVLMTLAVPSYFERAPATAMFPTPRVGRLMCVTQADVQT